MEELNGNAMDFATVERQWLSGQPWLPAATSGSTGTPKPVLLPRQLVKASAAATNAFFGIGPGARLHSCVGARFIGGKMMLIRALEAGAQFSWEEPSNRPLQHLGPDATIDLLAAVPSQMLWISANADRLPRLRAIIVGGSAISGEIRRAIVESGLNAYETYGMTETASHIALRCITADPTVPFMPLPGVAVHTDSRGCLCISRPGMEEAVTNDMAELLAGGGFRIVGRYDDMIVTGARKVAPAQVEALIEQLTGLKSMVAGVPHPKWGQTVVMAVPQADVPQEAAQWGHQLLEHLHNLLAPPQRPRRLYVVNELPLTDMGKPDRRALAAVLEAADELAALE